MGCAWFTKDHSENESNMLKPQSNNLSNIINKKVNTVNFSELYYNKKSEILYSYEYKIITQLAEASSSYIPQEIGNVVDEFITEKYLIIFKRRSDYEYGKFNWFETKNSWHGTIFYYNGTFSSISFELRNYVVTHCGDAQITFNSNDNINCIDNKNNCITIHIQFLEECIDFLQKKYSTDVTVMALFERLDNFPRKKIFVTDPYTSDILNMFEFKIDNDLYHFKKICEELSQIISKQTKII